MGTAIRNIREEDHKEEIYSNSKITAHRKFYEEYDEARGRWVEKKDIICRLFRDGSANQPLYIGECVNQAINQAKGIVDTLNRHYYFINSHANFEKNIPCAFGIQTDMLTLTEQHRASKRKRN
jgi:hypothetical protein